MSKAYTYTLKNYAKDAGIEGVHDTSRFIRRYRAQCAFNDQMSRIYADKTPWHQKPVPKPSPNFPALWYSEAFADPTIRLFYKACRKAEGRK